MEENTKFLIMLPFAIAGCLVILFLIGCAFINVFL